MSLLYLGSRAAYNKHFVGESLKKLLYLILHLKLKQILKFRLKYLVISNLNNVWLAFFHIIDVSTGRNCIQKIENIFVQYLSHLLVFSSSGNDQLYWIKNLPLIIGFEFLSFKHNFSIKCADIAELSLTSTNQVVMFCSQIFSQPKCFRWQVVLRRNRLMIICKTVPK